MGGDSLNLGMAQIIVTAATPMVEDGTDKSFPPVGERGGATAASSESNKAEKATTKSTTNEKKTTTAVGGAAATTVGPNPQQQATKPNSSKDARDENENHSGRPTKHNAARAIGAAADAAPIALSATEVITTASYATEDQHSSDQEVDSEVQPLQDAEDPFNEKATAGGGTSDGFEANFEANFDANFDDAFAGVEDTEAGEKDDDVVDIQAPKQVVGGRASIPEELDSNQLARLQNLKESNA